MCRNLTKTIRTWSLNGKPDMLVERVKMIKGKLNLVFFQFNGAVIYISVPQGFGTGTDGCRALLSGYFM